MKTLPFLHYITGDEKIIRSVKICYNNSDKESSA
jgi:hypothetical protein